MTENMQIYKCEICGNIVEMVHPGKGQLVCCDQPMALYEENSTDAAVEKHVPVMEKTSDGYKVTVGSVIHPMEEEHYIEWIEIIAGEFSSRKFLIPGDAPEAVFCIDSVDVTVRAYCNIHGLWKA
jgi:superoxide reductase